MTTAINQEKLYLIRSTLANEQILRNRLGLNERNKMAAHQPDQGLCLYFKPRFECLVVIIKKQDGCTNEDSPH